MALSFQGTLASGFRTLARPGRCLGSARVQNGADGSACPDQAKRERRSPDIVARADRSQLRRALLNLAKNAVVAAGASGQVVLAARADRVARQRIEWEIRDSGPGVPDEIRDKIFTPFFTTRERGTGLGLAFVAEIARDHGGGVSVDRGPEGGARFRFITPLEK